MMRNFFFTTALILLFASSAVGVEEIVPAERLKQRISAAKASIRTIDSTTLSSWLEDENKSVIILDVREPGEVSAGKIEADEYLAIPRGLLEMQFIKKIKALDTPVVVYCLKGSRGALAAQALTDLGYTNIHNLQGGLLQWIATGNPVSNFFGEFELQNFESNFSQGS
ncbi:MAG: rhodanese-like domain-containing protein [Desulforhopalus sp.]